MNRRLSWLVLGIVLVLPVAAAAGPTQPYVVDPALGCGQVLADPGTTYVLGGDLWCPEPGNGVVIAASDIVFHLAGHTIVSPVCDTSKFVSGIVIDPAAENVRIDGGTVSGFNDGLLLYGTRNRVTGMTFTDACVWGIVVAGSELTVETSMVIGNGMDGILLHTATKGRIASNFVSGNGRAGVSLSARSDGNVVQHNIVTRNGQDEGYGVVVFYGSKNTIRDNALHANFNGIHLLSPLDNNVSANTVTQSAHTGIFAADGHATIGGNSVFISGVSDMADPTPGCGSNIWLRTNSFQTDLVAGVSDGGPGAGCI